MNSSSDRKERDIAKTQTQKQTLRKQEETGTDKIGTNNTHRLTHEKQRAKNREDTRSRLYYRPAALSVPTMCHSFCRRDVTFIFAT